MEPVVVLDLSEQTKRLSSTYGEKIREVRTQAVCYKISLN